MNRAIEDIAAERQRQIEKEGWTVEHDDEHTGGDLAIAAALYASPDPLFTIQQGDGFIQAHDPWPWWNEYDNGDRLFKREPAWDKRQVFGRRRALVVAGALIAAEIERLDRMESKP